MRMTTQELTKEVVALDAKVARHDEMLSGVCLRLDAAEEALKEQNRILVVIERLTLGIDHLNRQVGDLGDKVDSVSGRLNVVELKPARKWETITFDLLKLLVAAGVGYLLSQISMSG